MTQRQITHPTGALPRCSADCGREPKHYHDLRAARVNGGHFLECAPCDRRTARHPRLEGAITEWHRLVGSKPAAPHTASSPVRAIR
jgi:hypothetical protein